jgi:hypothetical protein
MKLFLIKVFKYSKRIFLLFFLNAFINKKYKGKDFMEGNYSSRITNTKEYIFFNQVDAEIFNHFVPENKIKLFRSSIVTKKENKLKIENCKEILINGSDHYEANVILLKDYKKIIKTVSVNIEKVYFKPHPREVDSNIKLLKLFIVRLGISNVIFLSKDLTLDELPNCDAVLTAISSSINYYTEREVLILLSSQGSKIGISDKQYLVYLKALNKLNYNLII